MQVASFHFHAHAARKMATVTWKIMRSSRLLLSNFIQLSKCNPNTRRFKLTQNCTINRCHAVSFALIHSRCYSTGDSQPDKSSILKQIEEEQKRDEEEAKKKREHQWRTTKRGLIVIGSTLTVSVGWLLYDFGSPRKDEHGNLVQDEFSTLPVPQQYMRRIWRQLDYYKKLFGEPSRDKLLPDPLTYPYIQPPYTLVLEFTDLLVHPDWTYQTGWRFKKRPGVDHFLDQVAPPLFEVVVYTSEPGMTVFPILDALDPNGYVMYRLVRDATHFIDGHHVKALDHLNRDLSKVIVVDWNPESVKKHPRNTLLIPRWSGNDNDTTLIDLAAFLKMIAANKVDDVRDVLDYYQQFEDPIQAFRENQRRVLEQLEQSEKERKDHAQSLAQRWRPTFLNKPKA